MSILQPSLHEDELNYGLRTGWTIRGDGVDAGDEAYYTVADHANESALRESAEGAEWE